MANDHENRLMRILDHIHDHPAGDLPLDTLADVAACIRFHRHRACRAVTGKTAARHAVLAFTGPYAGLPAAYDRLHAIWLSQSGEKNRKPAVVRDLPELADGQRTGQAGDQALPAAGRLTSRPGPQDSSAPDHRPGACILPFAARGLPSPDVQRRHSLRSALATVWRSAKLARLGQTGPDWAGPGQTWAAYEPVIPPRR